MAGTIGRLFVEVGADTSKFTASMQAMMNQSKLAGIEIQAAGRRMIESFEAALNPTRELEKQLQLLFSAGKTQQEVWTVMGDRLKAAAAATEKMGQVVDPTIAAMIKFNKETQQAGSSFEALGKSIIDFVRNPVQSAQAGLTKILEGIGPMAVGLGAVATAAGLAAKALFNFVNAQAAEAEQLENLSAITGVSVQRLSALKEISKEAGLEGIDLGRMIGKLNQELGDSKPNEFTKAAERMGLSIKTASGQTKDAVTVLDEMRIMLLAIEDPAQRAQMANQLLGGRLRELIPLLLNSKSGLADLTQELINQGVVVDDLAHKRLLEFDTKMDLLGRTLEIGKSRLAEIGAAIFAFGDEVAKANPKLNLFAASMAFIIGGQSGMDLYNATVGNTATKTRELTDAEKDLHNKMINTRGLFAESSEDLKKIADAKKKAEEAARKLAESVAKLGDQYTKSNGTIYDAVDALEAWLKKTREAGDTDFLKEATKDAKELAAAMDDLYFSTVEAMGKGDKGIFRDQMDALPKFTKETEKEMGRILRVNTDTSTDIAAIWKRQVSTIATDFSKGFADIIFAGKSFGETLKSIFIDIGKSIVRALVETLFMPLQKYLVQTIGGLLSIGTASAATSGGGSALGAVGGLAGLGGMAGLAAIGVPAASVMGLMSNNTYAKVAGGVGLGITGMVGVSAAMLGGGFAPMMMAAFTNPVTAIIFGAALGTVALVKALRGPSTQDAAAKEVMRDLGVDVGKDAIKTWISQYIDPKQAWGVRKDLYMSPAFLSSVAGPAAQAQGRMPQFLSSLENIKTSWGTFNFREAFELGNTTGDWSELNKQFADAFEHSTELQKMLPNWREELMATGDATKDLADSTAGLTDKVDDIIQKFRQTGEVVPALRELFKKFGGDMKVLDDAAQLPGLQKQLGFINDLVGRMQALTPQATVLEEIFAGIWKPTTAATLTGMGIDPSKLRQFTALTGMTQGWDQAVSQFQQTGKLQPGGILYQGLSQYGGNAGTVALQRLTEGFNTITPKLLSDTYTKMQEAYQKEITSALDYLATIQKDVADKVDTLTTAIEAQLAIVSDNITAALNKGDKAIVDVLNGILTQLGGQPIETALSGNEGAKPPGTPIQSPVGNAPTIIINGDVYGYDDFAAKVQQAAISMSKRGSPPFATA